MSEPGIAVEPSASAVETVKFVTLFILIEILLQFPRDTC